jgi:hypothetical protein
MAIPSVVGVCACSAARGALAAKRMPPRPRSTPRTGFCRRLLRRTLEVCRWRCHLSCSFLPTGWRRSPAGTRARRGGDVGRVPRVRTGIPEELPVLRRGVPGRRDPGDALLVGGAEGHEPVRVDDPRAIAPSSLPSTITSSKGRPAPRATSGRRARHPPQPTPLVSSSHFAHPRWRRRPVVSSPGATVGRRCLLDAR